MRYGDIIRVHSHASSFPSLEDIDIALIGATEDRAARGNEGCGQAAGSFRKYFYQLFPSNYKPRIADLGNLKRGNTVEDSYFALTSVIDSLLEAGILPVVIGGGQDQTFAIYKAYKNRKQIVNIAAVDNLFDIGETEQVLNSHSYLSHIILHKPNYLFNFTNIGFQTHFVDPDAVELMRSLFFDTCRLGVARADLAMVEPMVRNADIVSFDISAIRQGDAPGNGNAGPNGFYAEEACMIARYAGLSDKLSSIGFFEMNPGFDRNGQTAQLLAQMVWYMADGFYHRRPHHPSKDPEGFMKYSVQVSGFNDGIVFYRSKKTDLWWMEVQCADTIKEKYKRHYLVPCSAQDYQSACQDEIPDRWWQAYQKLM
jgi:arginase family enzyme